MQDAIKATGIPADVQAVDCAEFPCIVYGEIKAGDGDPQVYRRKLEEQLRARFPEQYASMNSGLWTSTNKDDGENKSMFSLTPYPKEISSDERNAISKRVRYRSHSFVESQMGR